MRGDWRCWLKLPCPLKTHTPVLSLPFWKSTVWCDHVTHKRPLRRPSIKNCWLAWHWKGSKKHCFKPRCPRVHGRTDCLQMVHVWRYCYSTSTWSSRKDNCESRATNAHWGEEEEPQCQSVRRTETSGTCPHFCWTIYNKKNIKQEWSSMIGHNRGRHFFQTTLLHAWSLQKSTWMFDITTGKIFCRQMKPKLSCLEGTWKPHPNCETWGRRHHGLGLLCCHRWKNEFPNFFEQFAGKPKTTGPPTEAQTKMVDATRQQHKA